MIGRILLFVSCGIAVASAKHGATAEFNQITARYYEISQTPVRNATIDFGWNEKGQLLYRTTAADGQNVVRSLNGRTGHEEVVNEAVPALARREGHRDPVRLGYENHQSQDGTWEVIKRDGKLLLRRRNDSKEIVLATDGKDGTFEGTPYWSPDSKKFMMWQHQVVPERKVKYTRSSPKDQWQPEYFEVDYPKPGDALSLSYPWIFSTDGADPIAADRSLVSHAFEIKNPAWRDDSARLTYEYIERGFGKMNVIEINATTRQQRVLIREESDTFVYAYGYGFRYDLRGGEEILWNSERDGWNHLYLFDGKTGEVKKQLTHGEWVVKKVVRVFEKERKVLLQICGCFPDQDPYFQHYIMVHIDTGKITPLTRSAGHHELPHFSPDGSTYVCRWSRVDKAPVYEYRRTEDGALIKTLSEADDAELRKKWRLPQPMVAKDREGLYDIYGVVVLPPEFDANKAYPVVEYIYAGPHDAFTRKSWQPWMMPMHELACHGFIVVQMDGRGTAHRGKKFHDSCYKNLKDAGFPDRIAWMKSVASKVPQMDLTRVGIFGGSAGGQNAMAALLFHGDFYRAAVADCGCHDNRLDKIWWNEQWMDWPVGPHYEANSNAVHAKNLQGALMLTVGEVDTNVDPSTTMRVVDELIKADKDFELLVVPNGQHGVGETRHMQRKRMEFFRRHLGDPREKKS
jgi:dipeptidyl aminopeptidase/acylaminoacyl peptidase